MQSFLSDAIIYKILYFFKFINSILSWLAVYKQLSLKSKYHVKQIIPVWHDGLMRWLSSILANALKDIRSQPGTDYFVLYVCMLLYAVPSFATLPGVLIYSYGGI